MAHGPAREVTAAYKAQVEARGLRAAREASEGGRSAAGFPAGRSGEAGARTLQRAGAGVESTWAEGSGGGRVGIALGESPGGRFVEGTSLEIRVDSPPGADRALTLEILRPDGTVVASFPVEGRACRIEGCPLLPGTYELRVVDELGDDVTAAPVELHCVGSSRDFGPVRLEHRWG